MRMVLTAIFMFVLGAAVATVWLEHRARWLASMDFRVVYPPVPTSVTTTIRNAEKQYYDGRSPLRRIVEKGQDIITFAVPSLTYAFNFSVGPFRIKAATIEELLPWARENGYLQLIDIPENHVLQSIAYFSEQPAMADWGATVILEHLHQRHPDLRKIDWQQIASNPSLVAKLYSGYMGAGGAWDEWEATIEPGPEAKKRLGIGD